MDFDALDNLDADALLDEIYESSDYYDVIDAVVNKLDDEKEPVPAGTGSFYVS